MSERLCKAISIRQPWAWLIVNGHKDIENRSWKTNFRGPLLIHAAKGMTKDEYIGALVMAEENGVVVPDFKDLELGGIVGHAVLIDCVSHSYDPWFFGPFGFVMVKQKPLPFITCKGSLGFFLPDIPF